MDRKKAKKKDLYQVSPPTKRNGKGAQLPAVKFRKPGAPPTKVHKDKRAKALKDFIGETMIVEFVIGVGPVYTGKLIKED